MTTTNDDNETTKTTKGTDGARRARDRGLKPGKGGGSSQTTPAANSAPAAGAQEPGGTRARARPRGEKKLDAREELFVGHYMLSGNAAESYRAAGWKGNVSTSWTRGPEVLKRPHVRAEIERRGAARSSELGSDFVSRARWLIGVRDGTVMVEHAMPTGEGVKIVMAPAPPRERLKAAELLAKMHGDLLEKIITSNTLVDLMSTAPGADPEPKRE